MIVNAISFSFSLPLLAFFGLFPFLSVLADVESGQAPFFSCGTFHFFSSSPLFFGFSLPRPRRSSGWTSPFFLVNRDHEQVVLQVLSVVPFLLERFPFFSSLKRQSQTRASFFSFFFFRQGLPRQCSNLPPSLFFFPPSPNSHFFSLSYLGSGK